MATVAPGPHPHQHPCGVGQTLVACRGTSNHVTNILKSRTQLLQYYMYVWLLGVRAGGRAVQSTDCLQTASKPALCLRPATRHTCPPRPPAHLLPAKLRALPSLHTLASLPPVCLHSIISLLFLSFTHKRNSVGFSAVRLKLTDNVNTVISVAYW